MDLEEKNIEINEGLIIPKAPVTIHIKYNESLTLKELSEVLDLINKAINDVNRDNGIRNNAKLGKEYAAEVAGVDSGSIVLHILTNFVSSIALSILADYVYDRVKYIGAKKTRNQATADTTYPVSISVNGNENIINVYIIKPRSNDVA